MTIVIQRECTDTVYYIHNFIEDKVLCNNSRDKESLTSKIGLPTSEIEAAYLVLSLTRSSEIDVLKWKIALNSVILTREFKPHIEKPLNDSYIQSVFVYDVSRIINNNEALLKTVCNTKGYMYLDGATIIALLRYKGFHTHIRCEINPYVLGNLIQKAFDVTPSFKANEVLLHVGVVSPSNSQLDVSMYNDERRIGIVKGYNVVEVKLGRNNTGNTSLRIRSNNGNLRHIFSCFTLMYSEYPKIAVNDLQVTGSTIRLRLANIGSSRSDKVELLVLRYGIPVYRASLKSLAPQEHLDYEININNLRQTNIRTNNFILRIVWTKAYQLFEHDIPIKIEE